MSWREGEHGAAEWCQETCLACECDHSIAVVSVEQGPDADWIARGYESLIPIVYDSGEFRIEKAEHPVPVFLIEVQDRFAVRIRAEGVSFLLKLSPYIPEKVDLTIGYAVPAFMFEGLHPPFIDAHYREALESKEQILLRGYDPLGIRTTPSGPFKYRPYLWKVDSPPSVCKYCAHITPQTAA